VNKFERFKKEALKDPEIKASYEEGLDNLRLGVKLAQLRERAGLSQTKLAALIDSSQAVISRVESGGNAQLHTILKILHVLGAELNVEPLEDRQEETIST